MRALLTLAVVLAACQSSSIPASPAESVSFWLADSPAVRGASAFGTLPPERQAKRILTIAGYELATGLPTAPPTLNVYIAGAYPDSDTGRVATFGEPGWQFVPSLSLLQYFSADQPLGPAGAVSTRADASAHAAAVLRPRGLLPANTVMDHVVQQSTAWRVIFARHIDGRVDYTNKSAIVTLDATGRVRDVLIRRRPLLERSAYPTRSAQDAWDLARSGHWLTFNLEDGAPTTPAQVDRFVVRSVDIVYVEGEVLSPRDIIRPYFVFRDANDQTIYVSAIAGDMP